MDSSFFHAQRLGYRRNPFGALEAEEWAAVSFLPPEVEKTVVQGFTHLQLLGAKGVGKSSTLHRLRKWAGRGSTAVQYEYIPAGQRRFHSDLQNLDWFLLDEAQRLNGRWRRKWLQWGKKENEEDHSRRPQFIFGSHKDLSPDFRRRGLPLATLDLASCVTITHYQEWLARRLDYFRLTVSPALTLDPDAAAWLFHTFGRDMREAEYFLYEVWQMADSPTIFNAADLERLRR